MPEIIKDVEKQIKKEEVIFTEEFRIVLYQFIKIMIEEKSIDDVNDKIIELSNILKENDRGENVIILSFLLSLHFTDDMIKKMENIKEDEKVQDYIR